MKLKNLICAMVLLAGTHASHAAIVIPIDLNDFVGLGPVTIAANGSSAVMLEDSQFQITILSNDPGLGDPTVIIPGSGVSVKFDFEFTEPVGNNDDEFGAFVLDAADGLSVGPTFEFFTQDTSSGTVSFDISSLTALTLGMQFQLSALFGDADFNSTATVSNVRLEITAGPDIPEPASGAVWACGLVLAGTGTVVTRRFRRRRLH